MPRQVAAATRRGFLVGAASVAGALAVACGDRTPAGPVLARLHGALARARTRIEHVVVVMMENRSFDHLLGWLPRTDGRQRGLTYLDPGGTPHETHALAPDFQGCGHHDPDHSYEGGRIEYDDGACDGWLRVNDVYSIGYYRKHDLAFFGWAAPHWTSFDRYFCAIMAPTSPNRLYLHAAQTDRLDNAHHLSTLPTIWDRLAAAGLEGRYYFSDIPFLAHWGEKYRLISQRVDLFYADCATGTPPHVAFVEPRFLDEASGTSGDEHPFGDIRAGETFLNGIYAAITRSPCWPSTVLVINFDEWGGFFDHVPPPPGPIPNADRAAGNADGLRGFRTPAVLISPFARREHTSHVVFDHTSVLKLIEWRWGLEPLTVRDATANNLADELDFDHPKLHAPAHAVPSVTGAPCRRAIARPAGEASSATRASARGAYWRGLGDLARRHGWTV